MLLSFDRAGSPDNPPLVLVHGITERRASWDPVTPALAERFDVLRVDLRGHGESPRGDTYDPLSMAGDVVETWQSLGLHQPTLVGHSLGGMVVTAAAAISDPVAVVNVDQPLRLAGFKDGLTMLEPMLRGTADEFDAAIEAVFSSMRGPLSDAEVARIGALRHADQDVVLAIWGTVFDSTPDELDATVAQLASTVRAPYLSLHGIDPGDQYASWLRTVIAHAEVEVWADQGHYPHLVDPARFIDRVIALPG